MSILIAAIENQRDKEISALCDTYIKRLGPLIITKLELLPGSKLKDPAQQQLKETESLLKLAKPGDKLILCDEKGQSFTSEKFAEFISKELANSRGRLIFAIGGSYGFNREVLPAHTSIRLSDFTFPHQLARLVLCEQIYRAANIIKGTGYHH